MPPEMRPRVKIVFRRFHLAARRLRRAIREIKPKPAFTLIPITPERLAEKKRDNDHFFKTVLEEGVLVASED